MSFGQEVLHFRARNGLSQQGMAHKVLGVGLNMVYRYEHEISKPSAVNEIKFRERMDRWEEENK